ncbi:MAG: (p)ppGpp synthetase, partial [Treponema sp.]|nr:(p)ppGpp synthetase [Treponema sp.]
MAETSAVKEKFLLFPDQKTLREQYNEFLENRKLAINKLQICVEEALRPMSSIPTVRTRVKDFESYFKKYLSLMEKDDPASHPYITDIIGIRVVCSFMEDLSVVEAILQEKFEVIEVERKGSEHTFREFGYESVHILIKLPKEIININSPLDCEVAEIQIRTILQDAWAEVEHELIYKSEFNPFDDPLKRKLAAVNASLSLADIIFQEIRGYIRNLNVQLEKRRESFFRKIEESTDDLLFMRKEGGLSGLHQENEDEQVCCLSNTSPSDSIDDLLLEALTAHNRNQFTQAIACYTRILELEPENNTVCSIIFKHRGMAFFARSHYEEAIA